MAIARTQAVSANAASATLTSTTLGDLIVVFAYSTSTTIPTIPSGYITITSTAGTQQACACGWKVSAGSETTTGTWTNATNIVAMVYSGASVVGAVSVANPGSSTTVTYLSVTLQNTSGSSWAVAFGGAKSATTGMNGSTADSLVVRTNQTTVNGLDTGTGITTLAQQNITFSPTSRWFTIVVEILVKPANPYFVAAGAAATSTTGSVNTYPINILANDIVLCIAQSSNQAITGNTGFTEIDTQAHMATGTAATAGAVRLAVWWYRANGSESGGSTSGLSGTTDHCISQLLVFRGCATSGNPWSDVGTQFFTGSPAIPNWSAFGSQWLNGTSQTPTGTFSTTVDNSLVTVIAGQSFDGATQTYSIASRGGLLAGFALCGPGASTATGTGGGFGIAAGSLATAGTAGNSTIPNALGVVLGSGTLTCGLMVLALIASRPPEIPLPALIIQPMSPFRRRLFR